MMHYISAPYSLEAKDPSVQGFDNWSVVQVVQTFYISADFLSTSYVSFSEASL